MNETIQSLNKLLVDVPVGKGDDFLNTYGPDAEDRHPDYDNKVVFIHDNHTIFTQGDTFGGKEVTVGSNNSFIIGTSTYTLTINDGVLNIENYVPSYWTTYGWDASKTEGGGTKIFDPNNDYKVSITPSNKFSVTINHGTTEIAITGVKVNDNSNQEWTWINGGEAIITDGIATVNGNVVEYHNTNITEDPELEITNPHYKGKVTGSSRITYDHTSYTLNVDEQTAVIYYHEKGTNELKEKTIKSHPNSVTVSGSYAFLYQVNESFDVSSASNKLQSNLPITENITFTYKNKQSFGWFACPTSWIQPEPVTGMPIEFQKYDGSQPSGLPGGWQYADRDNRFSYIGVLYTLFRTENPVLATVDYRVKK